MQLTTDQIRYALGGIRLADYDALRPFYEEIASGYYELHCTNTDYHEINTLLAVELTLNHSSAAQYGLSPVNIHHHEGAHVIPVGDNLMAYRPRLDGAMGYECRCKLYTDGATDTRWSAIELKHVPRNEVMSSVSMESMQKVKTEMEETNYQPPIESTSIGYKVEAFELRRIK